MTDSNETQGAIASNSPEAGPKPNVLTCLKRAIKEHEDRLEKLYALRHTVDASAALQQADAELVMNAISQGFYSSVSVD